MKTIRQAIDRAYYNLGLLNYYGGTRQEERDQDETISDCYFLLIDLGIDENCDFKESADKVSKIMGQERYYWQTLECKFEKSEKTRVEIAQIFDSGSDSCENNN